MNILHKATLICGLISSFGYLLINIYVPLKYDGYSLSTFTVSELSAIGAPTRQLWVMLVAPNIPINGPTPWIGTWERINIAIFMAWVVVFALVLLHNRKILKSTNSLAL